MDELFNPVIFYVLLTLGAIGVALAMPRRGISPQIIGGLVAGAGFGGILITMGISGYRNEDLPSLYFYVFALISIVSGLRVITHPKPVYAAIYFVLTILSSSALYLLMQAEFMAFALIIIYAGAILITYLFVIMLATQAPSEERVESLEGYDSTAREPLAATLAGFALLAVLSGMMARGVGELQPAPESAQSLEAPILQLMPRKIIREYEQAAAFDYGLAEPTIEAVQEGFDEVSMSMTLTIENRERFDLGTENERFRAMLPETLPSGDTVLVRLPDSRGITNAEGVGYALIAEHPMALELAGIILLMAMLGAVVLARKQIELGEDEKLAQQRTLGQTEEDIAHVGGGM
ncbi:MAG: NADH-quinone oxidoreductase subunit J [Planctomycetota bacterium]